MRVRVRELVSERKRERETVSFVHVSYCSALTLFFSSIVAPLSSNTETTDA